MEWLIICLLVFMSVWVCFNFALLFLCFLHDLLYVCLCFIIRDSYRTVTVTEVVDGTERYSLSTRSAMLAKTMSKT